jgi:pimeloyl-ACP methyl ester carboxylesterase
VVLDAPSDQRELGSFRTTGDHAADVASVVRWARLALSAPVWLVGTSMGTVSVANAAVRLGGAPDGADGVIFTSAVLDNPHGDSVTGQDVGKIRVPALVVQHRDDGCPLCTPALLGRLERKLASSPRRQIVVVTGGVSEGPVCEAMAHHGFNGVEDEVVAVVARFIGGPARGAEPAAAPAAPDQRAR